MDQIEVAKLDGTMRTTLLAGDVEHPRAIALDPREGYCIQSCYTHLSPTCINSNLLNSCSNLSHTHSVSPFKVPLNLLYGCLIENILYFSFSFLFRSFWNNYGQSEALFPQLNIHPLVNNRKYISSSVLVISQQRSISFYCTNYFPMNDLRMNFSQNPVLDGLGCEHAKDRGCLYEWIWTAHNPQRDRKRRLAERPYGRLPRETNPLDRRQVRAV